MEFTAWFSMVVGPLLLIRAISILLDREHFLQMLDGVEREVDTASFSLLPVALFVVGVSIVVTHSDRSSLAAILIYLMAWGAVAKSTLLMLFPRLVTTKARALGQAVYLHVVCIICFVVGGYFTWFGYLARMTP